MSASDYAAWWGAGVATLALTWNIYRALRSGPRVKVTATPDIQVFPRTAITGDTVYISVTASNRGTAPTTLTNFVGFHEKTLLDLFLRRLLRRRKGFVDPYPELEWRMAPPRAIELPLPRCREIEGAERRSRSAPRTLRRERPLTCTRRSRRSGQTRPEGALLDVSGHLRGEHR